MRMERAAAGYAVRIVRGDGGFSASVPALPGCWSQGDTEGEALENIADAIREYLAAVNDRSLDDAAPDGSAAGAALLRDAP